MIALRETSRSGDSAGRNEDGACVEKLRETKQASPEAEGCRDDGKWEVVFFPNGKPMIKAREVWIDERVFPNGTFEVPTPATMDAEGRSGKRAVGRPGRYSADSKK